MWLASQHDGFHPSVGPSTHVIWGSMPWMVNNGVHVFVSDAPLFVAKSIIRSQFTQLSYRWLTNTYRYISLLAVILSVWPLLCMITAVDSMHSGPHQLHTCPQYVEAHWASQFDTIDAGNSWRSTTSFTTNYSNPRASIIVWHVMKCRIFEVYPLPHRSHQTFHTLVITPQNSTRYIPQLSPILGMLEGPHTLNVIRSGTSASYGNSICTGQPSSVFETINNVSTGHHLGSAICDVLPMLFHNIPWSIMATSGYLVQHTAFLNMSAICTALCMLQLLFVVIRCSFKLLPISYLVVGQ